MRKIGIAEILVFSILFVAVIGLATASSYLLFGRMPLGEFRGIILIAGVIVLIYAYALIAYRLFMFFIPLREGEIAEKSRDEFGYHIHLLFNLILFYSLMRSGAIPVPLMRLIYLALGARLGANTYSSGIIFDPLLVDIGANSIVGQFALLVPHVIEGKRLAHYKISIGDNVTIGAHAVVLADVSIKDNAIIAIGAVVCKGTKIGPNEVWGGIPARLLYTKSSD
ncbi:acyltransferase [Candidatus Nitrotoga sp. 1052]|uniref:acyltransferase n=1 Tax=Candidatus Nitrotoga sp. 1052 TaxID=2886964 RepID=UPI001EF514CC|nr:acyltransferase [Candidatus Nitrotoga sp. 1052]CAH1084884.1 Transferase [Candidatus Nitrotoga sp. 1052]